CIYLNLMILIKIIRGFISTKLLLVMLVIVFWTPSL
ncbi:glycolate permease glcA, partial [Shigella sonnei]